MGLYHDEDLDDYTMYNMDVYQEWTVETAIYPEAGAGTPFAIDYAVMGLVGEVGEVAGKVAKLMRDKPAEYQTLGEAWNVEFATDMRGELGDVLYFLARVAEETGLSLSEIADANVRKLESRKTRNVLGGSGDNR